MAITSIKLYGFIYAYIHNQVRHIGLVSAALDRQMMMMTEHLCPASLCKSCSLRGSVVKETQQKEEKPNGDKHKQQQQQQQNGGGGAIQHPTENK